MPKFSLLIASSTASSRFQLLAKMPGKSCAKPGFQTWQCRRQFFTSFLMSQLQENAALLIN